MEQRSQQEHDTPALGTAAAAGASPAPSGREAGPPISPKKTPELEESGPIDSGVDAGSSSEYDQENSEDHIIQPHDDDSFSDEGYLAVPTPFCCFPVLTTA